MLDVFVGRQPIYRKDLSLYAYELLFRGNPSDAAAHVVDNDAATSQVLYNAFIEIGLEKITGEHRAFVNLTERFLMGEFPLPSDNKRLVLEILEHVKVTPTLIDAVRELKEKGYKVALDDFVYRPELKPLVPMADIIKIDLRALSEDQLKRYVSILRDKTDAKLLAEKVETKQEFQHCLNLGFEFYQGYYFSKPHIIKGETIPHNKLTVLQLIARIQDPQLGMDELEKIISMDASLAYKLLRVVNSASFNLSKEVDSIKTALILLGMDNVKNWASMLALSQIDDKPHELMVMALVRANMSFELARKLNVANPDSYFTAGMLSILDALLDRPMDEILGQLPLSNEIRTALVEKSGNMGKVVDCVLHYEKGEWDEVLADCSTDLALNHIKDTYLNAVKTTEALESSFAN
ncbi:MAG: HDOD domain-containing protein [Gammaproteobacteria bacterium]|nr:HDOD domain-containing protein [Gammaproteobacteria bacterium]